MIIIYKNRKIRVLRLYLKFFNYIDKFTDEYYTISKFVKKEENYGKDDNKKV